MAQTIDGYDFSTLSVIAKYPEHFKNDDRSEMDLSDFGKEVAQHLLGQTKNPKKSVVQVARRIQDYAGNKAC